jgi:nicotinate phosphoribosyltransferase
MVQLSRLARRELDAAGFQRAAIVASGDLDEYRIEKLLREGALIDVWGVGTRLATAYDQPALGGVYKLSALRSDRGDWEHKLKRSDDPAKQSDPGILQVRRFRGDEGTFLGDVVFDELRGISPEAKLVPVGSEQPLTLPASCDAEDLLLPVFRSGRLVHQPPCTSDCRQKSLDQLGCLSPEVLAADDPHPYLVGVDWQLHQLKTTLLREVSGPDGSTGGEAAAAP